MNQGTIRNAQHTETSIYMAWTEYGYLWHVVLHTSEFVTFMFNDLIGPDRYS